MPPKFKINYGTKEECAFWLKLLDTPNQKSERLQALIDTIKQRLRDLDNANL